MALPVVITDNHNEVFYPWAASGLRDATLFHVDAHADMRDCVIEPLPGVGDAAYALNLGISRFICPAVHRGFIGGVAWLNPHSTRRRLQYLGSSRHALRTSGAGGFIVWDAITASRDIERGLNKDIGMVLRGVDGYLKERIRGPLILDVDLDAFSCCQTVEHVPEGYEGMHGWKQRLEESLAVFSRLPRPDLVTITRSQAVSPLRNGKFKPRDDRVWVPKREVDRIQYDLLDGLASLYGPLDEQSIDWKAVL